MFITSERVHLIEYLSMSVPTFIAFVMRPPPLSYVSNIYYLPFTGMVWICSVTMVILSTTAIAFTLRTHPTRERDNTTLKISDFFLFAMAALCQMGSQLTPKILSARISMVKKNPFLQIFQNFFPFGT